MLRGLIKCPPKASNIREKAIFISLYLKGCSILNPLESYQIQVHSFKSVIKNSHELAMAVPVIPAFTGGGWRIWSLSHPWQHRKLKTSLGYVNPGVAWGRGGQAGRPTNYPIANTPFNFLPFLVGKKHSPVSASVTPSCVLLHLPYYRPANHCSEFL